jgi:hypothetical protein
MIRDDEIVRLVKYAEALGVKVSYVAGRSDACADWVVDGSEIRIYTSRMKAKTDTILALIHELGHHLWFIHKKERQPDLKFNEALDLVNLYADTTKTAVPKRHRKKIYAIELEGAAFWDVIVKDTNIKLAKWKIDLAKEFDMWQYQVYYETGKFPVRRVRRMYVKLLTKKYRGY